MKSFDFDLSNVYLIHTFFLKGGLGVIWSFAWVCTIYDTPTLHPGLHRSETDVFSKEGANVSKGSQSVVGNKVFMVDTVGLLKVLYTRINSN